MRGVRCPCDAPDEDPQERLRRDLDRANRLLSEQARIIAEQQREILALHADIARLRPVLVEEW